MRQQSPVQMYQQAQPTGDELVMAHLGMVKRVALHLKARVPAFMELDELISLMVSNDYNYHKKYSL